MTSPNQVLLTAQQKRRENPPFIASAETRPSADNLLDLCFAKHDVLARHGVVLLLFHLARDVARILLGHIEIPSLRAAHEANEDGVRFGHGQQLQPAGRRADGFREPFLSMPKLSSRGKHA